ncbi:MAG: DUF4959 domain-containing protein [Cytophagales bacterium]|nr:DUF4959 domain-containing protein [Cytophagales bacterium]
MKNKWYIISCTLIILMVAGFISCTEEDERGPLIKDDTIPGVVSEIIVTNLPGGAKIEYKVPDDEDALMVEANYLRNGEWVTARSSIFKNYVLIEGLRKVASQKVALVTIDRSDNRSEPVEVTISPEKAPIDKLFESFELVADFGGVRVKYNNEDQVIAELLLYASNEAGDMVYRQSAFVNTDIRTHFSFRGFPPETNTFGILAIDRWDNITETLEKEILPLEEVLLDIENFNDVHLVGDEPSAWGWDLENLWNESIEGKGFHTGSGSPGTVVPPYTEGYHMFTIDLGVKAQLSRFKFWQRQGNYIFSHANPRSFEVWGIDEIPADNGASMGNNGWTRLIENGEVIKPSGAEKGNNSADDEAQAASGEEFEFPIDTPPVRYIRFVNLESWSGGKFMHLMEVDFWGQIPE